MNRYIEMADIFYTLPVQSEYGWPAFTYNFPFNAQYESAPCENVMVAEDGSFVVAMHYDGKFFFRPGAPNQPLYGGLGNPNVSFATRDFTSFTTLPASEDFGDRTAFAFNHDGSFQGCPVNSGGGSGFYNVFYAAAPLLSQVSFNVTKKVTGGFAFVQMGPPPYALGGGAPWYARFAGGVFQLVTGGLPCIMGPGQHKIDAYIQEFATIFNNKYGTLPQSFNGIVGGVYVIGLVTSECGLFYLFTHNNTCVLITITDDSILWGEPQDIPPALANIIGQGIGAIFQVGNCLVVLPNSGTYYNNSDTMQRSVDLITFRPSETRLPFPKPQSYSDYVVAVSGDEVFFEVPIANDSIHQVWAWNPILDIWRLFKDWTRDYNADTILNAYLFSGINGTNGAPNRMPGVSDGRSLFIPGAQSATDTYPLSFGIMTGAADPLITKVGYASTRNFVLNKRQMAYFQRLGMIRLMQEYL